MGRMVIIGMCAALLWPFAAGAQAPTKDKAAVTFNEIERGFFFGVQGGWLFITNPPAQAGSQRPFSPGQTAFVEVGYELGERISVAAFVMAAQNRTSARYTGYSENQAYSGDFSTLAPGATARFNLVGFNDSQDVRRTWLYARAGAGFALFSPKTLLPKPDVLAFAGPGVEYFTRLRHFSVGLEATGQYFVSGGALGFTVTPNLRYAF